MCACIHIMFVASSRVLTGKENQIIMSIPVQWGPKAQPLCFWCEKVRKQPNKLCRSNIDSEKNFHQMLQVKKIIINKNSFWLMVTPSGVSKLWVFLGVNSFYTSEQESSGRWTPAPSTDQAVKAHRPPMVSTGRTLVVAESSPGEAIPAVLSQRPQNNGQKRQEAPSQGPRVPHCLIRQWSSVFPTCFFYLSVAKIANPRGYLNSNELKPNEKLGPSPFKCSTALVATVFMQTVSLSIIAENPAGKPGPGACLPTSLQLFPFSRPLL